MFELLEIPKEEPEELEQFTPLDEVKTEPETIETVSKYDNLIKTVEELKNLLTNKE